MLCLSYSNYVDNNEKEQWMVVTITTKSESKDTDDSQAGIIVLLVQVRNYWYEIQILALALSCQNIWSEGFVDKVTRLKLYLDHSLLSHNFTDICDSCDLFMMWVSARKRDRGKRPLYTINVHHQEVSASLDLSCPQKVNILQTAPIMFSLTIRVNIVALFVTGITTRFV